MRKIIIICCLIMMAALTACGQAADIEQAAKKEEYTVICRDTDGNAIPGVTVQMCTDKSCSQTVTDKDGKAVFQNEPGMKIELISAPLGYSLPVIKGIVVVSDDTAHAFYLAKEDPQQSIQAKQYFDTPVTSPEDIPFSDYKLVLVNFWEPWCGYCVEEMPALEALYQKYKDEGFLIVGMYQDEEGAKEVLEETGVTYPVIRHDGSSKYLRTGGYPTSIFFNSKGEPLPTTEEEYYADIEAALNKYITAYQAGEYDALTDEETTEFKKKLDELIADKKVFKAYCRELAQEQISAAEETGVPEAMVGSADYDTWEARIKNRL